MSPMRCAVLGSPIEHSLSPVLHRAAYAELGLNWEYSAAEVEEPQLAAFIAGLGQDWRGLSLTMPLKRTVIELLDQRDELVAATGVANTVVFRDGRSEGFNTDIPGAANAIRERTAARFETGVILGGGATAASLGWALADLGCRNLRLFARNPAHAAETVDVIQRHAAAPTVTVQGIEESDSIVADIVTSTIPVVAQSDALMANLERAGVPAVFDVIYDPWPTPLAKWAEATGRTLVSGLDLLVHQAALQVELMSGERPSVSAMREAGQAALAAR